MTILAIEMSSPQSSVALVHPEGLVKELSWKQERRKPDVLYQKIRALTEDTGFDGMEGFAVGRGPGNYSGLRVAVTVAQGLALPDGKPVFAVSSGEALAHALTESGEVERVAVVGNARREKIWCGCFERTGEGLVCRLDWTLLDPVELPNVLPPGTLVAGPESEDVKNLLAGVDLSGLNVIDHDVFPSAGAVGGLVLERSLQGVASDPVNPLYLHPAVAVMAKADKKTED